MVMGARTAPCTHHQWHRRSESIRVLHSHRPVRRGNISGPRRLKRDRFPAAHCRDRTRRCPRRGSAKVQDRAGGRRRRGTSNRPTSFHPSRVGQKRSSACLVPWAGSAQQRLEAPGPLRWATTTRTMTSNTAETSRDIANTPRSGMGRRSTGVAPGDDSESPLSYLPHATGDAVSRHPGGFPSPGMTRVGSRNRTGTNVLAMSAPARLPQLHRDEHD
jgi:hypothetical protein